MEPNKKEMYNSPEVDIFEVKTEGAICTGSETGSGSLQDYNWNEPVIE